jgi:hypothetical protein
VKKALAAVVMLAAACSPGRRETAASPSATVGASAIRVDATAAEAPSPRAGDARWLAARDDDPAELMRLAAAEGAAGLLAGLVDGGATATTALRALPYADDAEAALGPLGKAALVAPPAQLVALLGAILAVAGQPRRSREALDPEGARACGEAVISLAARADVARDERAVAVSAARALAEKGYVDPRRIPGDLDPK